MGGKRKNYGITGQKQVFSNLRNVMKAVGQKYSIRVGIIGEKAYEKHPDTDLTNAQLGAIHEFGADITLKDTGKTIRIPARSFLRAVLLNPKIKAQIMETAGLSNAKGDNELNIQIALLKTMQGNSDFMKNVADIIAGKALEFVQTAFIVGGYPEKWQPLTKYSMELRVNANNGEPPLNDTGRLYKSITSDVKRVN